ncbi:hypothetical protein SPHINGOT1_20238 [Sphingomonas sp. T1]|nr:hypothetical protein SPHINGOT1_20238 [Sphingomonas sp. T1]
MHVTPSSSIAASQRAERGFCKIIVIVLPPVSAEHPGYDPASAKRRFGDRRPASTAGGALDRRASDVAVPRPGQMTPDAAISGAR